MQRSTWSVAVVASMAGFLFGFDTVVISGANLPIKELWQTSPWFHGFFIMSMALWGTVLGALVGGWPTDRIGRKPTLFWIGVLYTVSAIGSALAPDPFSFSFFRFIGGIGVGISSVAAPAYIAEISEAHLRGRLVATYQFNIVFGILIAFVSNFLLQGVGGANDWRWMLGVETVPAMLYTVLVLFIPESPRWLMVHRRDRDRAYRAFQQLGFRQIDNLLDTIQQTAPVADKRVSLLSSEVRRPLMLAFAIAFFNQLSGINFVLYYAPEILERAGLATRDSLFSSISLGGINLVFTLLGLQWIDRMGRRTLMLICSVGYIISLGMVAYGFFTSLGAGFLLTFLLLFIASHAIGQGTVIWVFISEIFPNHVRGSGQAFGASVHWVLAALVTLITPVFLDERRGLLRDQPGFIFLFFAGMMVLQLIWVLQVMPETRGRSLEEVIS
jgi:sugar porter (SP) family MFS transporter